MLQVMYFNPRAYVRHDTPSVPTHWFQVLVFQSTCLREARRSDIIIRLPSNAFQSTCLREARPHSTLEETEVWISIHVPT